MSPNDTQGDAWIREEPTPVSVAARVLVRARRRWVVILAVTGALAAALVVLRATQAPSYRATQYFLLEEGEVVDPDHEPRPPRDIHEHITNVALSRDSLQEIMRKHGAAGPWLETNPTAAISEFREDIEIGVERNYFIFERTPSDPPRSATVSLSYTAGDERQAVEIVHALGEAVLRYQERTRAQSLREGEQLFGTQLGMVRDRIASLEKSLAELAVEAEQGDREPATIAKGRMAAVLAELASAAQLERALRWGLAAASRTSAAESSQLGLRFVLVDERLEVESPPLSDLHLALLAATLLVGVGILTSFAVGAFDDRVHSVEDLQAAGVSVFGALSRFPGDDPGQHRADFARGA